MAGRVKTIFTAFGLAGAALSQGAQAAGFQLFEQSGSGLGNTFAGGAAIAEDASTVFFNPAGLTRLPGRQFAAALHVIQPTFEFDNEGSTIGGLPLSGTEGGNAGELGLVPNLYYAMDITPRLKFGLGVSVPFGLKTEYSDQSVVRYHAIKSEIETIDINPALAYKVNDWLSVGAGVSLQQVNAELTNAIRLAPFPDGKVKLEADDASWGYNLGILFSLPQNTRIGISFRSSIEHTVEGSAKFINVPAFIAAARNLRNTNIKATVDLPEIASISAYQQLDAKWALMGDITWTNWSRFDELRIRFASGLLDSVTPENWEDTYRLALGLTYQWSDALKIRSGVAYDQSAVSTEFRTPRIPDEDRIWIGVGASWKVSKQSTLDLGYVHIFIPGDADLRLTQPATSGILIGQYDSHADIVSVQFTHTF
jgi:long-chain fatty acid transport protein